MPFEWYLISFILILALSILYERLPRSLRLAKQLQRKR